MRNYVSNYVDFALQVIFELYNLQHARCTDWFTVHMPRALSGGQFVHGYRKISIRPRHMNILEFPLDKLVPGIFL